MLLKIISALIIGAALGAAIGYWGSCTSGQCPLTATPIRGALWGAALALIFAFGTKK